MTAIVGRRPTNFEPMGQKIGQSSLQRKQSIWRIESGLSETATLEKHLESLLTLLEQHEAGIRKALVNSRAGIQCAVYWHTSQPGFHLPPELLSRVAAIGVSLDFDMYCMDQEDRHEPVV